ncbi:hypothetical protein J6590_014174 [Homalodisca vitripennis]|nr:hypothetical protein J6590_014174 [Homalodisca vitripennis]
MAVGERESVAILVGLIFTRTKRSCDNDRVKMETKLVNGCVLYVFPGGWDRDKLKRQDVDLMVLRFITYEHYQSPEGFHPSRFCDRCLYVPVMHPENSPPMENGVKRQDVDLMILRFITYEHYQSPEELAPDGERSQETRRGPRVPQVWSPPLTHQPRAGFPPYIFVNNHVVGSGRYTLYIEPRNLLVRTNTYQVGPESAARFTRLYTNKCRGLIKQNKGESRYSIRLMVLIKSATVTNSVRTCAISNSDPKSNVLDHSAIGSPVFTHI